MEETIEYYKNDTVRGIENVIKSIEIWKENGGLSNPRETALVITKLQEARFWALEMVKRQTAFSCPEERNYQYENTTKRNARNPYSAACPQKSRATRMQA